MRYNKIRKMDISDGPGVRVSIFMQGCTFNCKNCFNPETHDFNGGKEFTNSDLKYILDNINKNNIKRNLAILGGEPLCPQNVKGVIELCKQFKKVYPEKMIYLWTGYVVEDFDYTQMEIFKYVDVLVDGKFEEDKKNLSIMLRGSSNQRVIDVNKSLNNHDIVMYEVG